MARLSREAVTTQVPSLDLDLSGTPSPSTSPGALPPLHCAPPSVSLGLATVAGAEQQRGGDWVQKRWALAAGRSIRPIRERELVPW